MAWARKPNHFRKSKNWNWSSSVAARKSSCLPNTIPHPKHSAIHSKNSYKVKRNGNPCGKDYYAIVDGHGTFDWHLDDYSTSKPREHGPKMEPFFLLRFKPWKIPILTGGISSRCVSSPLIVKSFKDNFVLMMDLEMLPLALLLVVDVT